MCNIDLDAFQKNKMIFINKYYDNEKTKDNYFSLYNNNIHPIELEKNKDLAHFTSEECVNMFSSFLYLGKSTKQTLTLFCKFYFLYNVDMQEIISSPMEFIKVKTFSENNPIILRNDLWGLNSFYKDLKYMATKNSITDLLILVLARYGVQGDKLFAIRNLRWRDIDEDNKEINIIDETTGEVIKSLPIDNMFIDWLREYKLNLIATRKGVSADRMEDIKEEDIVLDGNEYCVLTNKGEQISYGTCYAMLRRVCERSDMDIVKFKTLLFNRQFELLLELRKERQLISTDFYDIVDKFDLDRRENISITRVYDLIKKYEKLTKDEVKKIKNNTIVKSTTIKNDNPQEVYDNIIKNLGLKE